MKKLLLGLLCFVLTPVLLQANGENRNNDNRMMSQAGSFAITVTNDTPYAIQRDMQVIEPGQEGPLTLNATGKQPTFMLFDQDGYMLEKITLPAMLAAEDDVTFLEQGGVVIVLHNGLPLVQAKVQ